MNWDNYECEGQMTIFDFLPDPTKKQQMNVLIACEESQAVCKAFREKGHRAFSCDMQECSGGHPEWHIKGDALPLLNGNCEFTLQDGTIDRQTDRQMGLDYSTSALHIFEQCRGKMVVCWRKAQREKIQKGY